MVTPGGVTVVVGAVQSAEVGLSSCGEAVGCVLAPLLAPLAL